MQARYSDASLKLVTVTLASGEVVNGEAGPGTWQLGPDASAAFIARAAAGGVTVSPASVPSTMVPDGPTLSDWRVGLLLWGRRDELLAKVEAEKAKGTTIGAIADERVNYANNVLRVQLMQLADVFGFSPAEIDESLWRADRVRQGDLTGVWPLPAAAQG